MEEKDKVHLTFLCAGCTKHNKQVMTQEEFNAAKYITFFCKVCEKLQTHLVHPVDKVEECKHEWSVARYESNLAKQLIGNVSQERPPGKYIFGGDYTGLIVDNVYSETDSFRIEWCELCGALRETRFTYNKGEGCRKLEPVCSYPKNMPSTKPRKEKKMKDCKTQLDRMEDSIKELKEILVHMRGWVSLIGERMVVLENHVLPITDKWVVTIQDDPDKTYGDYKDIKAEYIGKLIHRTIYSVNEDLNAEQLEDLKTRIFQSCMDSRHSVPEHSLAQLCNELNKALGISTFNQTDSESKPANDEDVIIGEPMGFNDNVAMITDNVKSAKRIENGARKYGIHVEFKNGSVLELWCDSEERREKNLKGATK